MGFDHGVSVDRTVEAALVNSMVVKTLPKVGIPSVYPMEEVVAVTSKAVQTLVEDAPNVESMEVVQGANTLAVPMLSNVVATVVDMVVGNDVPWKAATSLPNSRVSALRMEEFVYAKLKTAGEPIAGVVIAAYIEPNTSAKVMVAPGPPNATGCAPFTSERHGKTALCNESHRPIFEIYLCNCIYRYIFLHFNYFIEGTYSPVNIPKL